MAPDFLNSGTRVNIEKYIENYVESFVNRFKWAPNSRKFWKENKSRTRLWKSRGSICFGGFGNIYGVVLYFKHHFVGH